MAVAIVAVAIVAVAVAIVAVAVAVVVVVLTLVANVDTMHSLAVLGATGLHLLGLLRLDRLAEKRARGRDARVFVIRELVFVILRSREGEVGYGVDSTGLRIRARMGAVLTWRCCLSLDVRRRLEIGDASGPIGPSVHACMPGLSKPMEARLLIGGKPFFGLKRLPLGLGVQPPFLTRSCRWIAITSSARPSSPDTSRSMLKEGSGLGQSSSAAAAVSSAPA